MTKKNPMDFCQSPTCTRTVVAVGALLCEQHMHAATLPNIDPRLSNEEAYRKALSRATHADPKHPHCWTIGRVDSRGYPYPILRDGKQVRPHRIVLEQFAAKPSETHVAEWACRNRACINPSHLTWVPWMPVSDRPITNPEAKPRNPQPNRAKLKAGERPEYHTPEVEAERRRHKNRERVYRFRAKQQEAEARKAELSEVL